MLLQELNDRFPPDIRRSTAPSLSPSLCSDVCKTVMCPTPLYCAKMGGHVLGELCVFPFSFIERCYFRNFNILERLQVVLKFVYSSLFVKPSFTRIKQSLSKFLFVICSCFVINFESTNREYVRRDVLCLRVILYEMFGLSTDF